MKRATFMKQVKELSDNIEWTEPCGYFCSTPWLFWGFIFDLEDYALISDVKMTEFHKLKVHSTQSDSYVIINGRRFSFSSCYKF